MNIKKICGKEAYQTIHFRFGHISQGNPNRIYDNYISFYYTHKRYGIH